MALIVSPNKKRGGGAETIRRKRFSRFVPCPVCGATEADVIVLGLSRVAELWFLRRHIEGTPVKCKKCGTQFDGLTGLPVDRGLSDGGTTTRFYSAVAGIIGLLLVVFIILKLLGRL
jgi:hypothetical protein